jgi:hypothetical protein
MSRCCLKSDVRTPVPTAKSGGDQSGRSPKLLRHLRGAVEWLTPGAALILLPKCPMCLAAYIAAGTGLGLSASTATCLREILVVLCTASLAYLSLKHARNLIWRARGKIDLSCAEQKVG